MQMSSSFKVVVLSLGILTSEQSRSADFHLVSVADVNDFTIGRGAEANSKKIYSYFANVAKALGSQLITREVSGSGFGCPQIKESLALKNVKPDDTVIFYYSGHGYRGEKSPSKFPSFYCDTPVTGMPTFGLTDVIRELQKTRPRLVVAVADTCNVLVGQAPPTVASSPLFAQRVTQLRKLFIEKQGVLMISSSKPGQFSWYSSNGGLFTTQFMRALNEATAPTRSGQWDDVLAIATTQIVVRSGDPDTKIIQNPQYDATKLHNVTARHTSDISVSNPTDASVTSRQLN